MYKYIQELLQNIIKETSRAKVRLKKNKNGEHNFQNNRKKISVKPEALAPVGTERQEVEYSADFIKLKNTYDLLMKRLSNQGLSRSLSSFKTVEKIKPHNIEREIKNIYMPQVFNGKKKKITSFKPISSGKKLNKATETLSIGWSGQVTRSSSQPNVEVALYPGDITSALLLYPEQEEDFGETGKQSFDVKSLKKRRSPRKSYTARKIKLFHDKTTLKRFDKPSLDILNSGGINSHKLKTNMNENCQNVEDNGFNQSPYNFSNASNSPELTDGYVQCSVKNVISQEDNVQSKLYLASNPFISFTSKIKDLYHKQSEKEKPRDIFTGSSLTPDKEHQKENPIQIKNTDILEQNTKSCENKTACDSFETRNVVGSGEKEEESTNQVKLNKETNNSKSLHSKGEMEEMVLSLFETKPFNFPDKKVSFPLHNCTSLINLTVSNANGQTNKSTKMLNHFDKNLKKEKVVMDKNPLEKGLNSHNIQEGQPPSFPHKQIKNETLELIKCENAQTSYSNPETLLDDLNKKYKSHLNNILKRTKHLEIKVKQENIVCTKLGRLSSFKCSAKGKTRVEEEKKEEDTNLPTLATPNLNTLQKKEYITANNLLEKDQSFSTNSTVNIVKNIKKQDKNNILHNPLNNNLMGAGNKYQESNLEPTLKTDPSLAKNTYNFSKDYILRTKSRQENKKNTHLQPTILEQEKKMCFTNLKSFGKGKGFENPSESISNEKTMTHDSSKVENKSNAAAKYRNDLKTKTVHQVFENKVAQYLKEKSDHLTVQINSNNKKTANRKNLIPMANTNKTTNSFSQQNERIRNILVQNVTDLCREKTISVKHAEKNKCLDLGDKKQKVKTVDLGLNTRVLHRETTNQNVINKRNAIKKSSSIKYFNENKYTNFNNNDMLYKSEEKAATAKNNRNRTEAIIFSKQVRTNTDLTNNDFVSDGQRKLYTKKDLKYLQVLSSLKKYGEEKKDASLTSIKSLRAVSVVKNKNKGSSKGSNRISFDRLSSRDKRGGVNYSILMPNRFFCTLDGKINSYLLSYSTYQQFSRMSTNECKTSNSNLSDSTGLIFSQLGSKGLNQESKMFSMDHFDKHQDKDKVSFKTKRQIYGRRTEDKFANTGKSQLRKKDGSVEVLFSRQDQKEKLGQKNNLETGKTKVFDTEETKKVVYNSPQIPFNVKSYPAEDNRPKWKSKGDRIISWKHFLAKNNNSQDLLISKLKTKIKTYSVPNIFNSKKSFVIARSTSGTCVPCSQNNTFLGKNKLIQKLDNNIQKEIENSPQANFFKLTESLQNTNIVSDNTNMKRLYQGEFDKRNLNSYFNTEIRNTTKSSLLGGKTHDNSRKSIIPIEKKSQNVADRKVILAKKERCAQDMNQYPYKTTDTIKNKYCDDGSMFMENNQHLNDFVKRHRSSLRINKFVLTPKEKRAKTAEFPRKSELMTTYKFNPDSLTSMKQPKVQVKCEEKIVKIDHPKYETKPPGIKIFKTNNFVPSSKLKEFIKINLDLQQKNILPLEKITSTIKIIPTSKCKLVNNVDYIKEAAELLPIDIMAKQITNKKISLPVFNVEKADKKKTVILQDKSSLGRRRNRENKKLKKRSQVMNNFSDRKQRETSISLTNIKKINNDIKGSKSEDNLLKKLENSGMIYKHLENKFANLNKRIYVKPATYYNVSEETKNKFTPNSNNKNKATGEILVTAPRKATSTFKQSTNRNYAKFINQYKLFQKKTSKLGEPKNSSEKVSQVNKKQTFIKKDVSITSIGMGSNITTTAEHRNISKSRNREKNYLFKENTAKPGNTQNNTVLQRSDIKKFDGNCKTANVKISRETPEKKRLLKQISMVNDFKALLENQIKQRQQVTDNKRVNLLPKTVNDQGLYKNQEPFKGRSSSCKSCSVKESGTSVTKPPETLKVNRVFGVNRASWDLSDEFQSCII